MFSSQLVALLYLLSVLIPVCLIAWSTVRRERFKLRFPLCCFALFLLQFLMIFGIQCVERQSADHANMIWLYSMRFFAVYVLSAVLVRLCFESDWWGAFFCANIGYCVQHIGARAGDIAKELVPAGMSQLWSEALGNLFIFLPGVLFWAFFTRKIPKSSRLAPGNRAQILITTIVIGFTIVYNSFGISFAMRCATALERLGADPAAGYGSLMFAYISSSIVALLALVFNLGASHNRVLLDEKSALEFMLAESRRQYESEKSNIEIINMKCHDLKHQLGAMKGKLYEEQLEELGQAIMIYDTSVKTGNETLDLVLSQKSLYCESRGIRLTCLLNGEHYSFIPRHELYALFDNALSNAVEAVEALPEEKRVIRVTEEVRGSFLSVCVENYFEGRVVMENGLPKSEKEGEGHGYGVKSIRMIAERNGGDLSISCGDGKFALNIYFLTA